jgi:hypothetical protein
MVRRSADAQLEPSLSFPIAPVDIPHTERARPRVTIETVTGTRTGIARCPALTALTLLTVSVVPAF